MGYSAADNELSDTELGENRMTAIYALFDRWTKKGFNKRNAKKPFNSKAFNSYLDERLNYMNCDYVIFATEWSD